MTASLRCPRLVPDSAPAHSRPRARSPALRRRASADHHGRRLEPPPQPSLSDTGASSSARSRGPARPPVPKVLEEDVSDGVRRQLIRYEAEPGLPVEAYLLRPARPGAPRAGRGRAALDRRLHDPPARRPRGPADVHLGLHLARRGYVAICPRCFLWQYGRPKQLGEAVDWLAQAPSRRQGHGQDALRRDPGRRPAGQPARRRSRPPRRHRPLAGCQGGALPLRVRPADPRLGLERGGHRPDLLQLGRPLVPRRARSAAPASRSTTARSSPSPPPGRSSSSAATRPTATRAGPTSRPPCPSGSSPAPPKRSAC